MPDPIRKQILDELETRLEAITAANGYVNTIDTVEIGITNADNVGPGERPWIGIIPQNEVWQDIAGHIVEIQWAIDLVLFIEPTTKTTASVADGLASWAADIRKALYAAPSNFSVDGMIAAKVVGIKTNAGVPEDAVQNLGASAISIVVEFQEVTSA